MKTLIIAGSVLALLFGCQGTKHHDFAFEFDGYAEGDTAYIQLAPDYRSPKDTVIIRAGKAVYKNDSVGDLLLARLYVKGSHGTAFVMERGATHKVKAGKVGGTPENDLFGPIYDSIWGGRLFSDIMEASRLRDSAKTDAEKRTYYDLLIDRHNRRDSIVRNFLKTDTLGVGLSVAYILRSSATPSEMGLWLRNHKRFEGDRTYQAMESLYRGLSQTDIGMRLPDFRARDVNGDDFTLYGFLNDFKGKAVIIDFWASWCHACRAKVPHLKELYAQYHAQGLEIIGVSGDKTGEPWIKAMKKDGSGQWVNVIDTANVAGRSYGISGIPKTFVIDRQGVVCYFGVGGLADETGAVIKLLNQN